MAGSLYCHKFIVGDEKVMYVRVDRGVGRELGASKMARSRKALAQPLSPVTTSGRSNVIVTSLLELLPTFYTDPVLWMPGIGHMKRPVLCIPSCPY